MDHFVLQLLLLERWEHIILSVLCFLVGSLTASQVCVVRFGMRRVTYFGSIAVLFFLNAIKEMSSVFLFTAANGGWLSLFVICILVSQILLGGLLYYVSAARSNDISGHKSYAWLVYVPFGIIWLCLRAGGRAVGCDRVIQEGKNVRLGDQVVISGAILIFVASQIFVGELLKGRIDAVGDKAVLTNMLDRARPIEELVARNAAASAANTPWRWNEVMVQIGSVSEGLDWVSTIRYEGEHQLDEIYEQQVTNSVCQVGSLSNYFDRGARVIYKYVDPEDALLIEYIVSQSSCDALNSG